MLQTICFTLNLGSIFKVIFKTLNTNLEQQIAFNEKERVLYVMMASKTILSILHRGFDKIKWGGKVMVLDEKSAEKLYNPLHLEKSD